MDKLLRLYINNRIPLLVFVIIIFVIGVIFGAIAVKTVDYTIKQDLFSYFSNFLQGYNNINYEQSTLVNESIKFNLLNIFIMWVFGISVIIMPLIPVLLFFKGFVLGFTTGFLVSQFNIKGIVFALVTVFPQNILITPVYILAGLTAIAFSINIFNYYRGRQRLVFNDFFDYTLRMVLLAVIMLGGTFLETYVSPNLFELVLKYL